MNIEKITQGKNLTDTERTVLEYILDHLDTVQTEGVRGVARANYTSTSTIMRLARKMNYSGFVDMCYKLRSFTETPHQTMQEEEDFLNGFSTQSLSGETTMVRDKIRTARENGVFTVAITGEQENSVGRYADLWFRVENQWKLDDQNTMPNTFFPQVMMLIELIAYEYRRLCTENGIK